MAVCTPVLQSTYRQASDWEVCDCPCAQILGFDILCDAQHKLHLLEVNNSPSLALDEVVEDEEIGTCTCMEHHKKHFHQDSPVDLRVKLTMGKGFFRLMKAWAEDELEDATKAGAMPPSMRAVDMKGDEVTTQLIETLGRVEQLYGRFFA